MKKNLVIAIFVIFIAQPVLAMEFNPNYIISDSEILDKTTMSMEDIQSFLSDKGGYLATYTTANFDGVNKTVANIIYEAAVNNYDCDGVTLSENPTQAERKLKCQPISINPQFLLVLLQKEQSLIDKKNPTQSQLDWATGYGCPDGGGCNERWRGLGKQVNSAALQFYEYMTSPKGFPYQVGQTYQITNPYNAINEEEVTMVTPANLATAALYNYTPHVYNGNYNFQKIWQQFFSHTFIDGSLVQVEGEPGVWLIQDGKKRPFHSHGALVSRYDTSYIITVKKSDLDAYPKGDPIKFAQYSLVKSSDGRIYLLVDDYKRHITDMEVFRKLGFNPEEVEDVTAQDLAYYQDGNPITLEDAYPTGALLQDPSSGGVYFVNNGEKAPLIDPIFLKTKFKGEKIIKSTAEELTKYTKVEPVKFSDGILLKTTLDPSVYVISNGAKRLITSGEAFEAHGFKWDNILAVHPRVLALYDNGEPLTIDSLK